MSIYGKEYNIDDEKLFIGTEGPEGDLWSRPVNDDAGSPYPFFRLNEDCTLATPEPLICRDALQHLKVDNWDDVMIISGTPTNCECTNWQEYLTKCFIPANKETSPTDVRTYFGFLYVPENEPCIVEDDACSAVYVSKSTYELINEFRKYAPLFNNDYKAVDQYVKTLTKKSI
jgi:hypothetical protein